MEHNVVRQPELFAQGLQPQPFRPLAYDAAAEAGIFLGQQRYGPQQDIYVFVGEEASGEEDV